jgi:two-component system phosphate regulon sensor histidine kinase PhoR
MQPKRRLRRFFFSYLAGALAILAVAGFFALQGFEKTYEAQTFAHLESRARLIEQIARPLFLAKRAAALDDICKRLGDISSAHVTFILPTGKVVGDSLESPERMDNHGNRPEVADALAGRTGTALRQSITYEDMRYFLAIPVKKEDGVAGVVRVALVQSEAEQPLDVLRYGAAGALCGATGLFFAIGFFFDRRIGGSLTQMRRFVHRFTHGEPGEAIALSDSTEIGDLEAALNRMHLRWNERINSLINQQSEQDTVLASMLEGVAAVDTEERILSMNQASGRLLEVNPQTVVGRPIQEVIRNIQLQQFITQALSAQKEMEEVISFPRGRQEDMFLQVHGTMLKNSMGEVIGTLIVMNDVTRLRKLENIRREFVANVSHELKTPITSIKGWVETLLNGALDDPQEARKFLEIVARQSDRLNAIIEDLLSLSRIEQDAEKAAIVLEEGSVLEVIQAAIIDCKAKAQEKNVVVKAVCEKDLAAKINHPLLEQALVNLIDNAIKYSEPGQQVEVSAVRAGQAVVIGVRDEGCGIPVDHLPRLFERFYRVDKARSRKLGGTGLGLAIVKHIAQAHKGTVEVASLPGQGSRFCIRLPDA